MLLCLPAALEVTIAPDQPMPFVYCDDPLILEVYSDIDANVSGKLTFNAAPTGEATEIVLEPFFVHADTGYWYAVQDAPNARGLFTLNIQLEVEGALVNKTAKFCRIDRPSALQALPLFAHCGGDSQTCVLNAIQSVGIETIRFNAGNEHLALLCEEVSRLGLHFILALSPAHLQNTPEYLSEVIESRCENILRFEVDCNGIEGDCGALTETFRQSGCPASMSLLTSTASKFSSLLSQSATLLTRHISLTSDKWPSQDEVRQIRYLSAQYGLEGQQIHVACPNWRPGGTEHAYDFLHRFFAYRAAGAAHVGLNAAIIADDMGIQEMMAYLNGLALHFSGQVFVGEVNLDALSSVMLFRNRANWLAVFWSENAGTEIILPVDGAINLALFDAFGNPIPFTVGDQGGMSITAGPLPMYLRGTGGVLMGRAAMNQLTAQTRFFLAQAEILEALPRNVIELIQKIQEEPRTAGSRLRYLELLRAIPWLEEQWHTRQLPKHIVVPAIMLISDIARSMAVIEEDRGELFLEPLSDTLLRIEEAQSLYLTGSAGSAKSRERGDWILNEVRRLVEETEALERAERKIEASAIGALGEARAQSLKPAAQAEVVEETLGLTPLPVMPVEVVESPQAIEGESVDDSSEEADVADISPDETEELETPSGEATEIVHEVVSGDNPYNISRKYNVGLDDLLEWNNLTKKSILRVGQKLVIRTKTSQ